jgi:hypothetical protein
MAAAGWGSEAGGPKRLRCVFPNPQRKMEERPMAATTEFGLVRLASLLVVRTPGEPAGSMEITCHTDSGRSSFVLSGTDAYHLAGGIIGQAEALGLSKTDFSG